ncbi:uncharacterized, partial [Tachysurus ichikawai]
NSIRLSSAPSGSVPKSFVSRQRKHTEHSLFTRSDGNFRERFASAAPCRSVSEQSQICPALPHVQRGSVVHRRGNNSQRGNFRGLSQLKRVFNVSEAAEGRLSLGSIRIALETDKNQAALQVYKDFRASVKLNVIHS